MGQTPLWIALLSSGAVGGIVAGLVTWLTNLHLEKRRRDHEKILLANAQRREESLHFIEERREAYTRFYHEARHVLAWIEGRGFRWWHMRAKSTLSDVSGVALRTGNGDDVDVSLIMREIREEYLSLSERLRLRELAAQADVMLQAVQAAQRAIYEALATVAIVGAPEARLASEGFLQALDNDDLKAASNALDRLLNAARRDLGRELLPYGSKPHKTQFGILGHRRL